MRLHIERVDPTPLQTWSYLSAAGRDQGSRTMDLPLLRAFVESLPEPLEGILATSDLQGICVRDGGTELLGEHLAEAFAELSMTGVVPHPTRVGVVLAGDLYSSPHADRRGASGDVRRVWRAFAERFRWVVGVAGNHDLFGNAKEKAELERVSGVHLLDDRLCDVDGLKIGGLGGIIGKEGRRNRRSPPDYERRLRGLLKNEPHMVVLHESPSVEVTGLRGSSVVASALEERPATLLVTGHCHWPIPVAAVNGAQVLNVDGRAVLLTPREGQSRREHGSSPASPNSGPTPIRSRAGLDRRVAVPAHLGPHL